MQELPDLTDVEARATAANRLDLHFEHRDALDVERGSLTLSGYLSRFQQAQVTVSDQVLTGEILAVGPDWMHLTSALVRLEACRSIRVRGAAAAPTTVADFRQAVRQSAGRVPREVLLTSGQARLLVIEWVAKDFLHVQDEGVPAVVPLGQVAAVFGRIDLGQ